MVRLFVVLVVSTVQNASVGTKGLSFTAVQLLVKSEDQESGSESGQEILTRSCPRRHGAL